MKRGMDELLAAFAKARSDLQMATSNAGLARSEAEQANDRLGEAEAARLKAARQVRAIGEELQRALPGYLAGATGEARRQAEKADGDQ